VTPRVDPTAFIAPTAVVLGDVTLGPRASVWYISVLRGDMAPITIGADSNIQDGSVVHVDEGVPCRVGERVGEIVQRMMSHGMRGRGMMGRGMCMRVMFALMDTDGDGTLSLEEFQTAHAKIFKAIDANKDGKVTLEEMQMFFHGGSPTSDR